MFFLLQDGYRRSLLLRVHGSITKGMQRFSIRNGQYRSAVLCIKVGYLDPQGIVLVCYVKLCWMILFRSIVFWTMIHV